jgi:hypothetical protein
MVRALSRYFRLLINNKWIGALIFILFGATIQFINILCRLDMRARRKREFDEVCCVRQSGWTNSPGVCDV